MEQRPLNQMGHVGLTCPCLHHPCTPSLGRRLTLTVTPRKTTEEGKIHSYLINLCLGTDAHKHKKHTSDRRNTCKHVGHSILHLCPEYVWVFFSITECGQHLNRPLTAYFYVNRFLLSCYTRSICTLLTF